MDCLPRDLLVLIVAYACNKESELNAILACAKLSDKEQHVLCQLVFKEAVPKTRSERNFFLWQLQKTDVWDKTSCLYSLLCCVYFRTTKAWCEWIEARHGALDIDFLLPLLRVAFYNRDREIRVWCSGHINRHRLGHLIEYFPLEALVPAMVTQLSSWHWQNLLSLIRINGGLRLTKLSLNYEYVKDLATLNMLTKACLYNKQDERHLRIRIMWNKGRGREACRYWPWETMHVIGKPALSYFGDLSRGIKERERQGQRVYLSRSEYFDVKKHWTEHCISAPKSLERTKEKEKKSVG